MTNPSSHQLTTRSPLRYPGGKTRAVKTLLAYFPAPDMLAPKNGTQSFAPNVLAPFLGGGSLELALTGLGYQVSGSDSFKQLVVFWNVLLNSPEYLADRLQTYKDNNVSKELFVDLQAELREFENNDDNANNSGNISEAYLEIAAKFYVVNRCSFSGATLSGGYSAQAAQKRFTQSSVDRIAKFTNSFLSVSHDDFSVSMNRKHAEDKSADFLFLDPPYLLGDGKEKLYGDRGSTHEEFDHHSLSELLKSTNIPFTLTYNDSTAVRELYDGFAIFDTSWAYGMNKTKQSSEVIITNHDYNPDTIENTAVSEDRNLNRNKAAKRTKNLFGENA